MLLQIIGVSPSSNHSLVRSISPTFYEQLLHQFPFAKKIQTWTLIREKLLKTLLYGKTDLKNVGELTHGQINFTNNLQAAFCMKVWFAAFLYLQFVYIIFCPKIIYSKFFPDCIFGNNFLVDKCWWNWTIRTQKYWLSLSASLIFFRSKTFFALRKEKLLFKDAKITLKCL